jgi:outer membrane protein assembly factor BamB
MKTLTLTGTLIAVSLAIAAGQGSQTANDALWEAAREGDTARIAAALDKGADVNAKSRYDVTALFFAASNGRLEAVKLLLARGADVNAQDSFYRARAADMAITNGHTDVTLLLLQNGAIGDNILFSAVQGNNESLLKAALAGKVTRQGVTTALLIAGSAKREAFIPILKEALGKLPADSPAAAPPPAPAAATPPAAAPPAAATTPPPATAPPAIKRLTGPRNWPSFRGDGSAGNGDGQRAVTEWDATSGKNIKWKTPIPGIATSSPIVWGNRVFVTTAVSRAGDNSIRTGLYGDVKPVDDLSPHEWKIYSLDKGTGKILWERAAVVGAPRTKRHTKSSQAGSTPVTDGRRVVAVFGSTGALIAWDFSGKELWRVDVGVLDSGWFFDPAFQWGHASSPIIYRNAVILQADVQKGSFLAAWDVATGKPLWKTERSDEISTWGTPTIARSADGRDVIVTNGTKVRGYDAASGKLLWTLGPNSEITIGTPVAGNGLVYVTGGYPPVRPIYAIRPGASGDISLQKGQDSNQSIAWSNKTEGTYIPTPLLYDGYLFTLNINGIVTAYDPQTGQRAFRGRVGVGGAFSASPIGADGRLYIASEDGEVYVVSATPDLKQIARNDMKEVIMSTPAISDGLIIVKTMGHVYGIGQ